MTIEELIRKLECISGPSSALDEVIAKFVPRPGTSSSDIPAIWGGFTRTMEQARLLIPRPLGSAALATTFAVGGFADERNWGAWAKVYFSPRSASDPIDDAPFEAKNVSSPAIALCVAALKARASRPEQFLVSPEEDVQL